MKKALVSTILMIVCAVSYGQTDCKKHSFFVDLNGSRSVHILFLDEASSSSTGLNVGMIFEKERGEWIISTGIGKHNTITLTYKDDEIEGFERWETINNRVLHATYKWDVTQSFSLTAGFGLNAQHYKSYFTVSRFWSDEYSPGHEKNAKTGSYNYTWDYLARDLGWIYPLVTNLGIVYTLAPNVDIYCQAEFQMPWSSDDLYDLLYDYEHAIRRAEGFNEAYPTKFVINAGIRYIFKGKNGK